MHFSIVFFRHGSDLHQDSGRVLILTLCARLLDETELYSGTCRTHLKDIYYTPSIVNTDHVGGNEQAI